MDIVYRVWGASLGDGAYLLAASENEAIEVVAGVFKVDEVDLKVAPDNNISVPTKGIIFYGSGKTIDFVPKS